MRRFRLRRHMPRLSYLIRWVLVQSALNERAVRRLPPAQRDHLLTHQHAQRQAYGPW